MTTADPHAELTAETAARRAADDFVSHFERGQGYLGAAVRRLCELTASPDPEVARAGVAGLFPGLVERLNDSFDPRCCALYDRAFAQVIEFYRRLPEGGAVDEGLNRFGLANEADLLARKSALRAPQSIGRQAQRKIKKILIPSRVTLGADVAVTSVMLAALRAAVPAAEPVLLGSRKLHELFGGDPGIRLREARYERGGGVLSRLESWLELTRLVADEGAGLAPDELWVIDPDSRLTQLGLLPLVGDPEPYSFFESRSYRRPGAGRLSELAALWVAETLARDESFARTLSPFVALPRERQDFGRKIARLLRRGGRAHVVSISLGVGGNAGKLVPDPFEEEIIGRLLADSAVILDKGASPEERARIDRLTAIFRSRGRRVVEVDEVTAPRAFNHEEISADLLTWDGGIGHFAALIAASDEYVGYDSAGQHIAAALAVPTLTIFVNSNSPLFAERWRPAGRGAIEVLSVQAGGSGAGGVSPPELLARAMALHRKLRNSHAKRGS